MKKIITVIFALTVILSLSVPVFAAPPEKPENGACEEMASLQKKFDSLSDVQKEQIYKQADKVYAQAEKLVKKYADFGVITKDEGQMLSELIESVGEKTKQDGIMPFGALPCPPAK